MAYYRGDYYRHPVPKGDYYRGHGRGDLKGFFKGLANVAGSFVGGALGIPKLPAISSAPTAAQTSAMTPPFSSSFSPFDAAMTAIKSGNPFLLGPGGALAEKPPALPPGLPPLAPIPSHRIIGPMPVAGKFLHPHRRRRMNPGNIKALRRSIRRVCSFGKVVTSMKSQIRKAANEVAPVHHHRALPPARRR